MIVKVSIGKSFGGCSRYLLEKEKGEVLKAEGVDATNSQTLTDGFNRTRILNRDLGKAVWHTSISFAPEDKVTNELMVNIAKDYVDKFKLEQYAVIRHHDGKREHFHIIANRVRGDGTTVSDKFSAGRGVELSHKLEQKYNLTQSLTVGKRLELTNIDKLKGATKVKYEILEAVKKELPKCKSLEDLQSNLKTKGIAMEIKKQSSGNVFGVTFGKGSTLFKGSEIDKTLGAKQLINSIANLVPGISQVKNIIQVAKITKDIGGISI